MNLFAVIRYLGGPEMGSSQLIDTLDPGEALKKMAVGASAAAISKTTTAPLDRVKLVMQVYGSLQGYPFRRRLSFQVERGHIAMKKYAGMSDCFSRIAQDQASTLDSFRRSSRVDKSNRFTSISCLCKKTIDCTGDR